MRWMAGLLILVLSAPIPLQAQAAKRASQRAPTVKAEYDRFRDRTTVTFDRLTFGGDVPIGYGVYAPELGLLSSYSFTGKEPASPDSVELRFVAMNVRLSDRSIHWRHAADRGLILLVGDSLRLQLGEARYDTAAIRDNGIENMRVTVPLATFLQIANASRLEGQLGRTEFALTEEQRRALRDFAGAIAAAKPAR